MYGFFVLATLAVAAPLAAAAAECPSRGFPPQPTAVTLNTRLAEPQVYNEVDRKGLTVQAGNPLRRDRLEAGLTRTETEFRVTPTVTWMQLPGGRHCMALARLDAHWIQTKVRVDVAREYRPGTCQYREVHAHEMEHVRLNRESFLSQVPRLEAELRRVAGETRPFVVGDDPNLAASRLTESLMARLQPLLAQFKAETARANAGIDTPESYQAVSARCESW